MLVPGYVISFGVLPSLLLLRKAPHLTPTQIHVPHIHTFESNATADTARRTFTMKEAILKRYQHIDVTLPTNSAGLQPWLHIEV